MKVGTYLYPKNKNKFFGIFRLDKLEVCQVVQVSRNYRGSYIKLRVIEGKLFNDKLNKYINKGDFNVYSIKEFGVINNLSDWTEDFGPE